MYTLISNFLDFPFSFFGLLPTSCPWGANGISSGLASWTLPRARFIVQVQLPVCAVISSG